MSWIIEVPVNGANIKIADIEVSTDGDIMITTLVSERIIIECAWLEFLRSVELVGGYHINYITNVITTLDHPISDYATDFDIIFADVEWYFDDAPVITDQSFWSKVVSKIKVALFKFAQLGF
jgi:hypothetical protein